MKGVSSGATPAGKAAGTALPSRPEKVEVALEKEGKKRGRGGKVGKR